MFLALSRFQIANAMSQEERDAFGNRPHLVDDATGFLCIEIWLATRWRDQQGDRRRHCGHENHAAHKGIPKGLKLAPGSAGIQMFNMFAG